MRKVLTERKASEKVARLEKEFAIRFNEYQKRRAIESDMGRKRWFYL